MMQDPATIPQVAGELRALIYLLGGGMSLLILKEVFSFMKSFKKNGNGKEYMSDKALAHIQTNSTEHALAAGCGTRLEMMANAQTLALLEIVTRMKADRELGESLRRRSSDRDVHGL